MRSREEKRVRPRKRSLAADIKPPSKISLRGPQQNRERKADPSINARLVPRHDPSVETKRKVLRKPLQLSRVPPHTNRKEVELGLQILGGAVAEERRKLPDHGRGLGGREPEPALEEPQPGEKLPFDVGGEEGRVAVRERDAEGAEEEEGRAEEGGDVADEDAGAAEEDGGEGGLRDPGLGEEERDDRGEAVGDGEGEGFRAEVGHAAEGGRGEVYRRGEEERRGRAEAGERGREESWVDGKEAQKVYSQGL